MSGCEAARELRRLGSGVLGPEPLEELRRRSRFVSPRRFFSCRRRSRAARPGAVGTRFRSTRRASRSEAASRSTASSRFRSWLRSSWATARSTGPAFPITRRFWVSVSAEDAPTSKTASTRVSDFCACWPPGPLEREVRSSTSASGSVTERVTRIDSAAMAAILLDVDGVLHVSGEPLPGAAEAVRRLRRDGHRLRFVTNTTTRGRAQLAAELRAHGIDVEDGEVQTTADAAVQALRGKRVLALVMHALVRDLEGIELVGEGADAVLLGGADETPETNLVFSYMNLARAFAELEMGAELYCLHRNRWWQTKRGPLLDSGAFVAGLEYAAETDAVVLGKPNPAYFASACEALDADPGLTWMVGDDLESDIAGAQGIGMRTILVRTGKFRPDLVERAGRPPDAILSSIGHLPQWLEEHL
jgi:HAD superfamily hydrolase (TIGR01458 family)